MGCCVSVGALAWAVFFGACSTSADGGSTADGASGVDAGAVVADVDEVSEPADVASNPADAATGLAEVTPADAVEDPADMALGLADTSDQPDGCAAPSSPDVLAVALGNVAHVALDGPYVYWLVSTSKPSAKDGALHRASLVDGCAELLLDGLPAAAILAHAGNVYVHDGESLRVVSSSGGVSTLYANAGGSEPYELTADETALYFATPKSGVAYRALLDGSSLATLATGLINPLGVSVDNTSLYVANDGDESAAPPYSNGSFVRMPKQAAGVVEMLTPDVPGGQDVAVANGRAYFIQFGSPGLPAPSGAVWRLDLPGGEPSKIVDASGPTFQVETRGTDAFVSGYVQPAEAGIYRVTTEGAYTSIVTTMSPPPFALGSTFVVYAEAGEIKRIATP